MPANFEVAFRDLLISEGHSLKLAERLRERLGRKGLNLDEKSALLRLLIDAGEHVAALDTFIHYFAEEEEFPLFEYLYLLHLIGFRPGKEFVDVVFKAQEALSLPARIEHFARWEDLDPRFVELRKKNDEALAARFEERKKRQLARLEYLRVNRLIDEEEKLLNDLVEMYPSDKLLKEEKEGFRERWAREVILQKSFETLDYGIRANEPMFTKDEIRFAEIWAEDCRKLAKKNPALSYDLTLFLCFMELYEHALDVLKFSPPGAATDWLYAEILLQARHYVECLDALASIETRYADDPETSFGVTYFRALALEGLGQIGTASELLRSIVAIRPNYRSAHSLLMKWAGGA